MFLWQQEVHWRGLRAGRSEVRFLRRDRCKVRAMGPYNSAWQLAQPLRVLVD